MWSKPRRRRSWPNRPRRCTRQRVRPPESPDHSFRRALSSSGEDNARRLECVCSAATRFAVVRPGRRLLLVAGVLLTAAACDVPSFGAPEPASKEGRHVLSLWQGFFIAAMVVGALVLGLITYALIRFRRRDDTIPNQRAYNVKWEIIY